MVVLCKHRSGGAPLWAPVERPRGHTHERAAAQSTGILSLHRMLTPRKGRETKRGWDHRKLQHNCHSMLDATMLPDDCR